MEKIDPALRHQCGVYLIFNLINGKRYVGSSKDIYNRFYEHIHNMNNQKGHNAHLQNAWNKYGENNFQFSVLEYTDEENQYEIEQYFIDTIKPEYNLSLNVEANINRIVSPETRAKISNTLKRRYDAGEIHTYRQEHNWKKVFIYDIKTWTFVAEFPCTADANRYFKTSHGITLNTIYKKRFFCSPCKIEFEYQLKNYVNQHLLQIRSKFGLYLIAAKSNGDLEYYLTKPDCAKSNNTSKGALGHHKYATIEKPFIPFGTETKIFYSNVFLPVQETAVPIKKFSELSLGEIGESQERRDLNIVQRKD